MTSYSILSRSIDVITIIGNDVIEHAIYNEMANPLNENYNLFENMISKTPLIIT